MEQDDQWCEWPGDDSQPTLSVYSEARRRVGLCGGEDKVAEVTKENMAERYEHSSRRTDLSSSEWSLCFDLGFTGLFSRLVAIFNTCIVPSLSKPRGNTEKRSKFNTKAQFISSMRSLQLVYTSMPD